MLIDTRTYTHIHTHTLHYTLALEQSNRAWTRRKGRRKSGANTTNFYRPFFIPRSPLTSKQTVVRLESLWWRVWPRIITCSFSKGNFLEGVASRENDDGIVESFPRDCGKLAASGRGCACRGWHTRPIRNNPDSRSDSERWKECYADCKNEQTERSLEDRSAWLVSVTESVISRKDLPERIWQTQFSLATGKGQQSHSTYHRATPHRAAPPWKWRICSGVIRERMNPALPECAYWHVPLTSFPTSFLIQFFDASWFPWLLGKFV